MHCTPEDGFGGVWRSLPNCGAETFELGRVGGVRSRMEVTMPGTRFFCILASLKRASVQVSVFPDCEARCEGALKFLIVA